MARRIIISLLYYCLLSTVCIWAQNPFGLRGAAFLRGVLFGTAADVMNLRQNYDNGEYHDNINENYLLIVPENELKPQNIWQGENQYNFADGDFLLGAPNGTGWVQQNIMQITLIH